jgi:hypothetical protein
MKTNKKPAEAGFLFKLVKAYLFITYIVTSKPKRISVAAGVVHMIISFSILAIQNVSLHVLHYAPHFKTSPMHVA